MGQYSDWIARDSRFDLDAALDEAASDYRRDFLLHWGFESSEPPDHLDHDAWIEYRRLYGLARQMAEAASTLLRPKGLGPSRLALSSILSTEAAGMQAKVDQVLKAVEERKPDESYRVYELFLPSHPSDPRTRHNVFRNCIQIVADEFSAHPRKTLRTGFRSYLRT